MKERGAGSTPPNLKVPAFLWATEYLPIASDPNVKWTGAQIHLFRKTFLGIWVAPTIRRYYIFPAPI